MIHGFCCSLPSKRDSICRRVRLKTCEQQTDTKRVVTEREELTDHHTDDAGDKKKKKWTRLIPQYFGAPLFVFHKAFVALWMWPLSCGLPHIDL